METIESLKAEILNLKAQLAYSESMIKALNEVIELQSRKDALLNNLQDDTLQKVG